MPTSSALYWKITSQIWKCSPLGLLGFVDLRKLSTIHSTFIYHYYRYEWHIQSSVPSLAEWRGQSKYIGVEVAGGWGLSNSTYIYLKWPDLTKSWRDLILETTFKPLVNLDMPENMDMCPGFSLYITDPDIECKIKNMDVWQP